jgi:hypothetical protein
MKPNDDELTKAVAETIALEQSVAAQRKIDIENGIEHTCTADWVEDHSDEMCLGCHKDAKPETCECKRFGKPCPNPATHQWDISGDWFCGECWDWLLELLDAIARGDR